ncbi:MFS transporter [Flavilitoribacter nigricans DSM 23189 = NBRC 102662]|uniref:MFS transporter n=1 Tax=Flavilitoribacter nigricans (strain ATCC 23147 / DSM 23189 / NBRC 102662 / NCIMB 1420 / SS-2) TaxID=1122177 RepID=A0A2D0NK84_FLAN2|nr:MFS transporter [Flavilitoribacter nigricans DSM 23189 = NBRC 102662]
MEQSDIRNQLKQRLDDRPMSAFQIMVVALCFVLNMNDGMDVLVVSYTGTEIMSEWGLSKSQLGWIFSTGLIGMTLGAIFIAPLGDKIGRRNVFILSLVLNTVGMLSVYLCTAYWQILVLRVITGLGIGGIIPSMATITSEYSNKKTFDFNVGLIQGGWPFGAILTGFFAAWAVPEFGWRFAYLFAGSVSLLMLILVWFLMPESLAFLSKQPGTDQLGRINQLLAKMQQPPLTANELSGGNAPVSNSQSSGNTHWKALLSTEFKGSTLRLWTGIFFGFMTLYTLMSWVPSIATDAGMPFTWATYAGMALNLGALIGVIAMGLSASYFGPKRTILTFLVIAFGIMLAYANLDLTYAIMFVLIFLIGFFVQGGFNTFFPIAAHVYPSDIRATGVGLAMGIGRFGAILGPLLFGVFFDWGMNISVLFTIFSVPLLVAAFMAYTIPSKGLR